MAAEKQLFVLRHAKSSWDDPGLDDHERPLAPRGRRATELLAKHLRAQQIEPTLVLCSSARRTRETLEGVEPAGEVRIERDLFHAGVEQIFERLRQIPADTPSVMVIGHNPALQMLVLSLAAGDGDQRAEIDPGTDLAEVARKFPTGALATVGLHCAWEQLAPGCAELTAFVRPRDLRGKRRRQP